MVYSLLDYISARISLVKNGTASELTKFCLTTFQVEERSFAIITRLQVEQDSDSKQSIWYKAEAMDSASERIPFKLLNRRRTFWVPPPSYDGGDSDDDLCSAIAEGGATSYLSMGTDDQNWILFTEDEDVFVNYNWEPPTRSRSDHFGYSPVRRIGTNAKASSSRYVLRDKFLSADRDRGASSSLDDEPVSPSPGARERRVHASRETLYSNDETRDENESASATSLLMFRDEILDVDEISDTASLLQIEESVSTPRSGIWDTAPARFHGRREHLHNMFGWLSGISTSIDEDEQLDASENRMTGLMESRWTSHGGSQSVGYCTSPFDDDEGLPWILESEDPIPLPIEGDGFRSRYEESVTHAVPNLPTQYFVVRNPPVDRRKRKNSTSPWLKEYSTAREFHSQLTTVMETPSGDETATSLDRWHKRSLSWMRDRIKAAQHGRPVAQENMGNKALPDRLLSWVTRRKHASQRTQRDLGVLSCQSSSSSSYVCIDKDDYAHSARRKWDLDEPHIRKHATAFEPYAGSPIRVLSPYTTDAWYTEMAEI
jgi:hypothetical protein